MQSSPFHVPVLCEAVCRLLVWKPDGTYVDATVGGGGHAAAICRMLLDDGQLVGLDRDADALTAAGSRLSPSAQLRALRFSQIGELKSEIGAADGVLADLGISSFQIDRAGRGFSHRFDGPLDMRMDQSGGETAAELIARSDEQELARILRDYGEEPQAGRIARAIVRTRDRSPITTTIELERIVSSAVAATRIKSLARVFQALRIAVNDELGELEAGLKGAFELLGPGGRLVVISYHSLEDRMVKQFMQSHSRMEYEEIQFPIVRKAADATLLTRKPIIPDKVEIDRNPRARSAKLRAVQKIG